MPKVQFFTISFGGVKKKVYLCNILYSIERKKGLTLMNKIKLFWSSVV